MSKKGLDPQLVKNVTIEHDKLINIIAAHLLVNLDRLKLYSVNFFLCLIRLLHVLYHAQMMPSMGCCRHFYI